ncbi:MAG: hypothetical protein Q7S80_00850 [bacterium]|nr:hypothetical protein [bacterium]
MKQLKYLWYLFSGLFLVLLDVSFLSNFDVYGASIITSFLILIIMAISNRDDDYIYFSLILIILFSIFSSLPLGIIAINFLVLPITLNIIIKKYFPRPNHFTIMLYFIFATFIFDLVLLIWSRDWSATGLLAVGYFVVINSFAGWIINSIYFSFKKRFTLETEVKI